MKSMNRHATFVAAGLLVLAASARAQAPYVLTGTRTQSSTAHDSVGLCSQESNDFVLLNERPGPAELAFQFGASNTAFSYGVPIAGDFDGDGEDSVGLYDPWTNVFALKNSNASGNPDLAFSFGSGPVFPLCGDFDGDRLDTIGVFDPATNLFKLRNSNSSGPADVTFKYGAPGAFPLMGDWDGDGLDTVGTFNLITNRFELRNSNSSGPPDLSFTFGPSPALPLVGDWDGDGVTTVAVYAYTLNQIHLRNSNSAGPADRVIALAPVDWLWFPLAGNWRVRGFAFKDLGYQWLTATPDSQGIDGTLLANAYQKASALPSLHSLLVVRHGYLVGEQYYRGFHRGLAGNIKSVSKSILSAVAGIAWRDGYFTDFQRTVYEFLPEYFADGGDPRKRTITLGQLLTMTADLAWIDEGNDISAWFFSSDWVQFVLDFPLLTDPGTSFHYSTGNSHVLARVIAEATSRSVADYAQERLFDPLGIDPTRWDHDRNGHSLGGAELFLRPRDMARFGHLYLKGGVIDGTLIVPPFWVKVSTSEQVPESWIGDGYSYGAYWWRKNYAGHDVYFAWGHGGQFVFNIPALDMIVVATSKWAVDAALSAAQSNAVFDLLEHDLLPAVTGP